MIATQKLLSTINHEVASVNAMGPRLSMQASGVDFWQLGASPQSCFQWVKAGRVHQQKI